MNITDGFFVEDENKVEGAVPYLKGVDFDGEGQTLEVGKLEVFTPKDIQYSAQNTYGVGGIIKKENYLVKTGVLKEGESLKYRFMQDGVEKYFSNHSAGFFFAVKNAGLELGDKVNIKRSKKSNTDIEWTITKIK